MSEIYQIGKFDFRIQEERIRYGKDFKAQTWLKYNPYEGLNYSDYASDILNYRPLFGKELNSSKILILIKLWESKTIEGAHHTLEILGRSAGIKSTYVSTYIEEMCQASFKCVLCNQRFGILEKIGKFQYENGNEGNLYSLEKIETFLMHVTVEHRNQDPETFYKTLTNLESLPKAKTTVNQMKNLKNQWDKRRKQPL